MYEITEVIKAPSNSIAAAEALARVISAKRGVFCFTDYNDSLHHECVYVTNAPSKEAYEADIENRLREA